MTAEALNTAQAGSPTARPSFSTLSWVTTAQTVLPPGMARVISAFTGPSEMRVT